MRTKTANAAVVQKASKKGASSRTSSFDVAKALHHLHLDGEQHLLHLGPSMGISLKVIRTTTPVNGHLLDQKEMAACVRYVLKRLPGYTKQVSQSTISRMEGGDTAVSWPVFVAYCIIFQQSPESVVLEAMNLAERTAASLGSAEDVWATLMQVCNQIVRTQKNPKSQGENNE